MSTIHRATLDDSAIVPADDKPVQAGECVQIEPPRVAPEVGTQEWFDVHAERQYGARIARR